MSQRERALSQFLRGQRIIRFDKIWEFVKNDNCILTSENSEECFPVSLDVLNQRKCLTGSLNEVRKLYFRGLLGRLPVDCVISVFDCFTNECALAESATSIHNEQFCGITLEPWVQHLKFILSVNKARISHTPPSSQLKIILAII